MKKLSELQFVDSFVKELPEDPLTRDKSVPPEPDIRTSRLVNDGLFSKVIPQSCADPFLISVSDRVCNELLLLDSEEARKEEFLKYFCGNELFPGMCLYAINREVFMTLKPSLLGKEWGWACNYAGFQFGEWAGQLGDGRAITLGSV
jgi:uncharacterized protein YdiU (UPF0061 family)